MRGRKRKPQTENRTNSLKICLTDRERRVIDVVAHTQNLDTSTWCRQVFLEAAERLVAENKIAIPTGPTLYQHPHAHVDEAHV
jgi:hypothetical protein